jgi:hypothetical protein
VNHINAKHHEKKGSLGWWIAKVADRVDVCAQCKGPVVRKGSEKQKHKCNEAVAEPPRAKAIAVKPAEKRNEFVSEVALQHFSKITPAEMSSLAVVCHEVIYKKEVVARAIGEEMEFTIRGIEWAIKEKKDQIRDALLKKFFLVPAYVLRVKGRGKRVARDSVLARLDLLREEKYDELHAALVVSLQSIRESAMVEKEPLSAEVVEEMQVSAAIREIKRGRVSKGLSKLGNKTRLVKLDDTKADALSSLLNSEVALAADKAFREGLVEKATAAAAAAPAAAADDGGGGGGGAPAGDEEKEEIRLYAVDIENVISGAKLGVSSSTSGVRWEHLKTISSECSSFSSALAKLGSLYIAGSLPSWFYSLLVGGVAVALPKGDGGLRPIVMVETMHKLFASALLLKVHTQANQYLAPHQTALQKAACTVLPMAYNLALQADKDSVLLALDMSSAYSTVSRASIEQGLKEAKLASLLPLFRAAYGQQEGNLVNMRVQNQVRVIAVKSGVFQGDSLSPLFFSVAVQPFLKKVGNAEGVKSASGFYDDFFLLAKPTAQFADAVGALVKECASIGLKINLTKSVALSYSPDSLVAFSQLAGLEGITKQVDLSKDCHILLGVPIGQQEAIKKVMVERMKEEGEVANKVKLIGESSVQCAQKVLDFCVASRSIHLLRAVFPSTVENLAKCVDAHVTDCFRKLVSPFPFVADDTIPRIRLPKRDGGMGLSSLVELSPGAFVGAVADVLFHSPSLLPNISQDVRDVVDSSKGGDQGKELVEQLTKACKGLQEKREAAVTAQKELDKTLKVVPDSVAKLQELGTAGKAQHA